MKIRLVPAEDFLPKIAMWPWCEDLVWGLLIWRLDDQRVSRYLRTTYSNPQTQEFTID